MPTTCITNSVILSPGESFILPPGATIIGSNSVDSITSTCADLNDIEGIECFEINWILESSGGSATEAWEIVNGQDIRVSAFKLGDVTYTIDEVANNIEGIKSAILAVTPPGLIDIYSVGTLLSGGYNANDEQNYGVAMRYKTLTSLGLTAFIEFSNVKGTSIPRFFARKIENCSNIGLTPGS